jgi:hypothetical protein
MKNHSFQKFFQGLLHQLIPNPGSILVMAAMLFVYNARAAGLNAGTSPSTISYQGTLSTASGTAINAAVGLTFSLYNVQSGGSTLWTEAHTGANAVPVTNGLFNVLLGSITPIPASVWDNTTVYLGVQVEDDGDELSPREMVSAVPMAMMTLTIPDNSIATAKIADGAVTGSKVMDGSLQSRDVHLAVGKGTASQNLTLTSSFQDVPGTQLTISPDTAQTFLIITTADLEVGPSAEAVVVLFVDGIEQNTFIVAFSQASNKRGVLSQTYLINLNAGNHTLILKSKLTTGSGGWVWSPNTAITYLAVSQ